MGKPFKIVANPADVGDADHYGGVDIDNMASTLNAQSDFSAYSYFIYLESGTYKAKSGDSGVVAYSNANLHSVIQSIIDAAATNAYLDIVIGAGYHIMATQVSKTGKSHFRIRGLGKDVTTLACKNTFAITPMFSFVGTESGTFNYTVTANMPVHTNIATVTTGQVTNFAVGDYVRISSDELADTSRKMGEIHKIAAINTGTGAITLDNYLAWDYTTANNARIIKMSLISDITISDMEITDERATLADLSTMLEFKFAENLSIHDVEIHDCYNDGIYMQNVINSDISNYSAWNIKLPTAGTITQYGIQLTGACQGITVTNCHGKGGYRHFVVTDGWGDGMPRNITFTGCSSYGALYAGFNTHDSGDNITFVNCHSWGGKYDPSNLLDQGGFEIRSRHTNLVGCSAFYNAGRAIHVTNQGYGSNIVGCTVIGTRKDIDTGLGDAISIEGSITDVNIDSCYIDKAERKGIALSGANDGCKISNCIVMNTLSTAIDIASSDSVTLSNNKVHDNAKGLILSGTTDNCRLIGNEFADNTSGPTLVGSNNYYFGNTGITNSTLTTIATTAMSVTPAISPTQITSQQNNYTPTSWNVNSVWRLDADSSFRTITGIGDATQTDGMRITIRNISNNSILLADASTTPAASSTAANRMDFGGFDVPLFPKQQLTLAYDSTSARWFLDASAITQIIPPSRLGLYQYYDAMHTGNMIYWTTTTASGGTISNSAVSSVAGHPTNFQWTCGNTATSFGGWRTASASSLLLGNSWYWRWDTVLRIEKLSDGTDTYTLRAGFLDNDSVEPTDGVYFRYTHSVNSGKWVLVGRSNNAETTTNATNTAVAATTWYHLTVIVNPAGTLAEFFQDGVSIGTVAANIPTTSGRGTGTGITFLKSVGTTDAAVLTVDSQEVIAYANVAR